MNTRTGGGSTLRQVAAPGPESVVWHGQPSGDEPATLPTAHGRVHGRRLLRLTIALSALLVALGIAAEPSGRRLLTGALVFYSFAIVVLPLLRRSNETLLSPLYFLALIVFLSNPLRFFVIAAYPQLSSTQWFLADFDLDDFYMGAVMTAVGLTAMVVGYHLTTSSLPLPKAIGIATEQISVRRLRRLLTVLVVVSTAVAVLTIRRSGDELGLSAKRGEVVDGVRFANGYVTVVFDLLFAAIAVLAMVALSRHRRLAVADAVLLTLGVSIILLFAFISQDRSSTAVVLLGLAIVFAVALGHFPWRAALTGIVVGGALFLTMTDLRESSRSGVAERNQVLRELSPPERLAISVGGAFNMGGFVANTHAHAVVPDTLPYAYGRTFVEAATRPIPRQVWRDKPVATGQTWIAAFRGDRFGASAGGGAAPGLLAESYWNFGWLGILTIPALLGLFLRLLSNAANRAGPERPVGAALAVLLAMGLPQTAYGRDFASGLVVVGLSLAAVIFVGLATRLEPPQPRHSAQTTRHE